MRCHMTEECSNETVLSDAIRETQIQLYMKVNCTFMRQ